MTHNSKLLSFDHSIGLIPCAGYATRISPLPCSKEIYPVGWYGTGNPYSNRPRVISSYLLESMKYAGAETALMAIRKGKWDIPNYFGNGNADTPPITYVVVDPTDGVPFTIDECYPYIKNKRVLFGFPDIYIHPVHVFSKLIEKQNKTKADIVLGLFKAGNPSKMDMVELDQQGRIHTITIKPEKTSLTHTWITAVWNDRFTDFLHRQVEKLNQETESEASNQKFKRELFIGDIVQRAIYEGFHVNSVTFPDGQYLDIGTKSDLKRIPSVIESLD